MAPSEVQHASGFATGGSQTFAATLSAGATAGNLLIYCIGGDKDIGTLTLSGYTKTVDLRSTSTSLTIAWKTAVGGETTVSGTISGANTGGSAVWVFEWSESGSGPWEVKGSATNNTNESTVTTTSSGTTGSVTSAGRAIAGFSSDSVITEGTVSYSNSYAAMASTPSGAGGNAGFWAAGKDITSGTTDTTITRTGGSADQMSGAVVVFGRAPAQTVTATGIATAEAIGSATVSQAVVGTGVATAEAFGTATVAQNIVATGIATAEALGSASVVPIIAPSGIISEEAFGSATVTAGDPHQTLTLTGIATAEAFGTTTLGGPIIFPVSISSTETFGSTRFVQNPTRVQSRWIFLAKNTFTFNVPYDVRTATAGNVMVFVGSFHHDIGTLTLDGTGWHYPVNLRSASLSLVIAWKTAAGGETGISGSFTTGNDTGSNMVAIEYTSQAPGMWAQFGEADHNTDLTNVLSWSSGTTPASIGDGIAVAGFGINNVGADSTDSFSNSYTTIFEQGGGAFESGVWAAEKLTAYGATTTTTLTRSGAGVAAKTSGAVVILGKAAVQTITATPANTGETFGQPDLPAPPQPPSIDSAEAFGSPTLAFAPFNIQPSGLVSGESFGFPVLHTGPILQVTSIASAETFGALTVEYGRRLTYLGGVNPDAVYLGGVPASMFVGAVLVWGAVTPTGYGLSHYGTTPYGA